MRAFQSHEFAIGRTWPFLFLEDRRACGDVPIDDAGPQAGPADNLANLARLSHHCHGLQDPGVAAAELAELQNLTRSRGRCGIRCAWPALSRSTRVNNGWSMCSRMEPVPALNSPMFVVDSSGRRSDASKPKRLFGCCIHARCEQMSRPNRM